MFDFVRQAHAEVVIGDNFAPAQSGYTSTSVLVNILVRNILVLAGVVAFVGVVFAGVKFIAHAGGGNAQELDKSKGAFTAALMGLIIVVGAFFIVQIINTLTGLNFLNPTI